MKKLLTEFIGTFFLVLTVGCTVALAGGTQFAPIAIGLALMVMVYAGGHISGGHFNPAVSLGAAIRGVLEWKQIIFYWIAQTLGATAASLIVIYFMQGLNPVPANTFDTIHLAIAEILFTFALVYVVLNTATSPDSEGNSYYGMAIGLTVTVGAFAAGGLCLAAFNPAVAIGAGIMHFAGWKIAGITVVSNFIGAIAAAIVYRMTSCGDFSCD